MNERKTTENLKSKIRSICNEWQIEDSKISSIVTDGGANIKKAIKEEFGDLKHISCFGHTINNIGQRLLQMKEVTLEEMLDSSDEEDIYNDETNVEYTPFKQLIIKVKTIVRVFKHSTVASTQLEEMQEEAKVKQSLKLIQEVCTRWNSCYEMVERFILLEDYVSRVLLQLLRDKSIKSKPPNMLTGDELEQLNDVRDILKPLWRITTEISGEKLVTISKCIPLVLGLQLKIEYLCPTTQTGRKLKETLKLEILQKFGNIESVKLYGMATLLDPRFKKSAFSNIQNSARMISYIGEHIKSDMAISENSLQNHNEDQVQHKDDSDDILSFLDKSLADKRAHSTFQDDGGIPVQLREYLSKSTVDRASNSNPFLVWAIMKKEFPYVWKATKKNLPVVATSVPCERLFSHAGTIANQLRNRMSPEHLTMLVFLRSLNEDIWLEELD